MQDDVKLPPESAQPTTPDPPQPAPISDIVQAPPEPPSEQPQTPAENIPPSESLKETSVQTAEHKKSHHVIPIIFAILILLGLGAVAVISGINK